MANKNRIKYVADDVLTGKVSIKQAITNVLSKKWTYFRIEKSSSNFIQITLFEADIIVLETRIKGSINTVQASDVEQIAQVLSNYITTNGEISNRRSLNEILRLKNVSCALLSTAGVLLYVCIFFLGLVLLGTKVSGGGLFCLLGASLGLIFTLKAMKDERTSGRFFENSWAEKPCSFIFFLTTSFVSSLAILWFAIVLAY